MLTGSRLRNRDNLARNSREMRSGVGPSAPACSGLAGAAPTIALLPIPQIVSLALPGPNALSSCPIDHGSGRGPALFP